MDKEQLEAMIITAEDLVVEKAHPDLEGMSVKRVLQDFPDYVVNNAAMSRSCSADITVVNKYMDFVKATLELRRALCFSMGERSFSPWFTASAHRHERIVAGASLEALRASPRVSKQEKSNQDEPAAPSSDIVVQAQGSIAQPKATVQRRVRAIVEEEPAADQRNWETMLRTSSLGRSVHALDSRLSSSWRLSMLITTSAAPRVMVDLMLKTVKLLVLLMLHVMRETATQVVHEVAVEALPDSMSLQVVGGSAISMTVGCLIGCIFRRRSPVAI